MVEFIILKSCSVMMGCLDVAHIQCRNSFGAFSLLLNYMCWHDLHIHKKIVIKIEVDWREDVVFLLFVIHFEIYMRQFATVGMKFQSYISPVANNTIQTCMRNDSSYSSSECDKKDVVLDICRLEIIYLDDKNLDIIQFSKIFLCLYLKLLLECEVHRVISSVTDLTNAI